MKRSAIISDCGAFRYRLERCWDDERPPLFFGMLNPSTADALVDDPTISRCMKRAHVLGFGGLVVWNLFAFRATDPGEMKAQKDPVGPDNDAHVAQALRECLHGGGKTIVAWGAHGAWRDRDKAVTALAQRVGAPLHCLGTTRQGRPRHPLYVKMSERLISLSRARDMRDASIDERHQGLGVGRASGQRQTPDDARHGGESGRKNSQELDDRTAEVEASPAPSPRWPRLSGGSGVELAKAPDTSDDPAAITLRP